MKVLLIWPYNKQGIEIKELFPLGIGFLVANIPEHHEVSILDCTLDGIHPTSPEFKERISAFNPDVVGVSFWSNNAEDVRESVKIIRSLTEAKIIFGGPHATNYGTYEVKNGHTDYAMAGEAETAFPLLLDLIENGGDLKDIPGRLGCSPASRSTQT